MSSFTMLDILQVCKNAIVHGIDENGNVVGSGDTPTYGGTSANEDFYTDDGGFNVYIFQKDSWDSLSIDEMPRCMIAGTKVPASESPLTGIIEGLQIEWQFQINEFCGKITIGDTTYINEAATFIYLERLMELIQRIQFPDVEITMWDDIEPVFPSEAKDQDTNDTFAYFSGASLYIEYIKEL